MRSRLEVESLIFVVQCKSNLAPSRRRRVSELRSCTFFGESCLDISLNLSKTVNWKKNANACLLVRLFYYAVDLYFYYANSLSKTSCVNFTLSLDAENCFHSEKCIREMEISVIPLYYARPALRPLWLSLR